jgi:hypothetical protein
MSKAKEKAIELVDRFKNLLPFYTEKDNLNKSKKCALIACEELVECLPSINGRPPNYQDRDKYTSEFWEEVKQEIEKL